MKNQIDMNTLKSLIKDECSSCNLNNKTNICQDCNFKNGRDGAYLKKYNINGFKTKTYIFYFLYHPELNCKLPELPDEDFLGTKRESLKQWRWEIHHEDEKHWNDVVWNMLLVLKSEHRHLHGGVPMSQEQRDSMKRGAPGFKQRIEKQLETRRKNNTIDVGCIKSILTEDQVIEIKKRLVSGERTTELAKEFGRGVTTIDNIKQGNSWKHIKI